MRVRAMLVRLTEDLEVNPESVELTPYRCPVFHVRQLGYGYKLLQITSLVSHNLHMACITLVEHNWFRCA